jgi:hypothetical protein
MPALHAEAVVQALDCSRLGLVRVFLRPAERFGMHEGEMREVGKVVHDEEIVRVVVHVIRLAAPLRIRQVVELQDLRRVGERGIAHPDPHQVLLLEHRVAANAQAARDVVLPRDLDALAARVELEPVVHAADVVALHAPVGELGAAVAAPVVQRNHPAAVALVEQHRLLQDRAREQLAVDQLVVPRRDVPAVLQKGLRLGSHRTSSLHLRN